MIHDVGNEERYQRSWRLLGGKSSSLQLQGDGLHG
jgi:hypothetical protein